MRNKRLIIALTGAVICGLLGVVLVTRYLSQLEAHTRDVNNVVIAKVEIPLGTKITGEQLALAPIPNSSVPDGVFRKLDEVVGRVAITPIGVRETITSMKLAPAGMGAGLPAVIPDGYRALTVRVDEVVGVSGFLMPGSFVDVVAVILPVQQAAAAQGPISKIVLQNIKVLASGAKIDSPENQREPTNAKAVTLQVTPEQAEKLVLAANEGKLQLVMRNYSDQEDTETRGSNKASLLGSNTYVPQPTSPEAKAEQPKPSPAPPKPLVKRAAIVPVRVAPVVPPARRNTIELIEGVKRRDVELP
jgi:pilus assembly protein CpaB